MNPGDLFLDLYPPLSITGTPIYYAIVVNRSNQALRATAPDVYGLSSGDAQFVNADQQDCAIVLQVDRLDHYSVNLLADDLTLPASEEGDVYTAEFWRAAVTGSIYNRTSDSFISHERFYWDGNYRSDQRIAASQFNSEYTCQVGSAYDSVAQTATHKIWLEQGGTAISDPQSCTFVWKDQDGSTIYSGSSTSPDVNGIFTFAQSTLQLEPDKVGMGKATVVDSLGNPHTTNVAITCWD